MLLREGVGLVPPPAPNRNSTSQRHDDRLKASVMPYTRNIQ
jgi:hypothetical protein